jgi:GDPmannose 4,6-dehydratase
MKTALITGISGQDGSYLAEFLLNLGYRVCGMDLGFDPAKYSYLLAIKDKIEFFEGDLRDSNSVDRVIEASRPDEIYSLASQSGVELSLQKPYLTADVTAMGPLRLLESTRRIIPSARFFQASSSEIFGNPQESPQTEDTPLSPRNPYGWAKAYAQEMVKVYREEQGLFACSAICYNHESPRRPDTFVTRKITQAAARIKLGLENRLVLGDITSQKDWGFAGDYVEAFWLMLQQTEPDDYILATGRSHTVEDFCRTAFEAFGLDFREFLEIDQALFRDWETKPLTGNPGKARNRLGWEAKIGFTDLVNLMAKADLEALQQRNPG